MVGAKELLCRVSSFFKNCVALSRSLSFECSTPDWMLVSELYSSIGGGAGSFVLLLPLALLLTVPSSFAISDDDGTAEVSPGIDFDRRFRLYLESCF